MSLWPGSGASQKRDGLDQGNGWLGAPGGRDVVGEEDGDMGEKATGPLPLYIDPKGMARLAARAPHLRKPRLDGTARIVRRRWLGCSGRVERRLELLRRQE